MNNIIPIYIEDVEQWDNFSYKDIDRFFNFANKPVYKLIDKMKLYNERANKYLEVIFVGGDIKRYNNINGILVEDKGNK